jgi:hypothetical protein
MYSLSNAVGNNQIKGYVIGRTCRIHRRNKKCTKIFGWNTVSDNTTFKTDVDGEVSIKSHL